jgi:hypothetical protein
MLALGHRCLMSAADTAHHDKLGRQYWGGKAAGEANANSREKRLPCREKRLQLILARNKVSAYGT